MYLEDNQIVEMRNAWSRMVALLTAEGVSMVERARHMRDCEEYAFMQTMFEVQLPGGEEEEAENKFGAALRALQEELESMAIDLAHVRACPLGMRIKELRRQEVAAGTLWWSSWWQRLASYLGGVEVLGQTAATSSSSIATCSPQVTQFSGGSTSSKSPTQAEASACQHEGHGGQREQPHGATIVDVPQASCEAEHQQGRNTFGRGIILVEIVTSRLVKRRPHRERHPRRRKMTAVRKVKISMREP